MGTISISIQNRSYRLSCGDGEEARLTELAEYVRAKAEQLTADHGRIADEHLMLMSAILIADELWDQRAAGTKPVAPTRKRKPAGKAAQTADEPAGPSGEVPVAAGTPKGQVPAE